MPLDVENAVGCYARNGGKNATTVRPSRACQTRISAHILPEREDGVVKRALKRGGWKTLSAVAARFVDAHELQPSIGTDVRAVESLTIQLEVEWQRDERITVIAVIAAVVRAWHYRVGTRDYCVLVAGTRRCCRCWRWLRLQKESAVEVDRRAAVKRTSGNMHSVKA